MSRALLFFSLFCLTAQAKWLRMPYESVRATGMGNAFIAIADDKDALWYNPAGLAFVKGIHFDLYDFVLGGDSNDSVQRLRKGFLFQETAQALRADTQFGRFGFFPTYHSPYFGVGAFYQLQGFTEFGDLTIPVMDVYGASDLGAIMGVGFPVSDRVALGVSARVFTRTGVDFTEPTTDFLNGQGITGTDFLSNPYESLRPRFGKGWALGFTAGLLAEFPVSRRSGTWKLGLTVDDVASTKFTSIDGNPAPGTIPSSYNAGVAYLVPFLGTGEFHLAFDARNLASGDSIIKMIHTGMEAKWKGVGVRMGINQGYFTAGLGYEMSYFRVQASTYANELGANALSRGTRWYLFQVAMGLTVKTKSLPKVPGWTPPPTNSELPK